MELERRAFSGIEVREVDSGKVVIGGLAAPFNKRSELLYNYFTESIESGAFEESIKARNVVYLVSHDQSLPVAMSRNQTLKLEQRADGLYTEVEPNGTSYAVDLIKNVRGGYYNAQSVGMVVEDEDWDQDKKTGAIHRKILKAELWEVSAVVWPAYPQTDLEAIRSRFAKAVGGEGRDQQKKYYKAKMELAKQKRLLYL
jgi:HK97 family phage prohead protease